jgi:lactonase
MNSDGSKVTCVHPKYRGKTLSMNDLVFDPRGSIYVTDFSGTVQDPTGGVYRLSSDGTEVQAVLQKLASPNGISLSPEGNVLWVGETTRNAFSASSCWRTASPLAHSRHFLSLLFYRRPRRPGFEKIDKDGNLYQCLNLQGRAIVLNKFGIPIANVRFRDAKRESTWSRLIRFKPGTREAYIIAAGQGGAWIYRFEGLAEGLFLF